MRSLIKNKRGDGDFLGEETVKLIVSVFSIGILLILAGSLFYMFIKSSPIKKADAILEEIERIMETLDGEEVGRVIISNPGGKDFGDAWYLLQIDDKLCICKENVDVACDDGEAGVCRTIKEDFNLDKEMGIKTSLDVLWYDFYNGIPIRDIFELVIFTHKGELRLIKGNYIFFKEIDGFLSQEVSFSGQKVVLGDFILEYISGNIEESSFTLGRSGGRTVSYSLKADDVKDVFINEEFGKYFVGKEIDVMKVKYFSSGSNEVLTVEDGETSLDEHVYKYNLGGIGNERIVLNFYS